jgi:hypothetical protein
MIDSVGPFKIIAKHSDKCLGVSAGVKDNNGELIQWSASGGDEQRFLFIPTDDGCFVIVAVHSGRVLDVRPVEGENTKVIQWSLIPNDAQKWRLMSGGEGYFFITNKETGEVLDVENAGADDGAAVIRYALGETDNQRFRLEP